MDANKYKIGFLTLSTIYLLLLLCDKQTWAVYLKPLLIPILILLTYQSKVTTTPKAILTALLFSWLGDTILIFADINPWCFIAGLVFFLIAHIAYIYCFTKQEAIIQHTHKFQYWFGYTLILIYLFGFLSFLLPKLGDLQIPVGCYAMTISLMLIEALKGHFNWKQKGKTQILIGALFFVISDSILAINKFYNPIPYATLAIMSTYIIAQYNIITGLLRPASILNS